VRARTRKHVRGRACARARLRAVARTRARARKRAHEHSLWCARAHLRSHTHTSLNRWNLFQGYEGPAFQREIPLQAGGGQLTGQRIELERHGRLPRSEDKQLHSSPSTMNIHNAHNAHTVHNAHNAHSEHNSHNAHNGHVITYMHEYMEIIAGQALYLWIFTVAM
jgi:hypothetical protein